MLVHELDGPLGAGLVPLTQDVGAGGIERALVAGGAFDLGGSEGDVDLCAHPIDDHSVVAGCFVHGIRNTVEIGTLGKT